MNKTSTWWYFIIWTSNRNVYLCYKICTSKFLCLISFWIYTLFFVNFVVQNLFYLYLKQNFCYYQRIIFTFKKDIPQILWSIYADCILLFKNIIRFMWWKYNPYDILKHCRFTYLWKVYYNCYQYCIYFLSLFIF